MLDRTFAGYNVGSSTLMVKVNQLHNLKLHVFGHIHEAYGKIQYTPDSKCYVNASHVNEDYEPVNAPISILL